MHMKQAMGPLLNGDNSVLGTSAVWADSTSSSIPMLSSTPNPAPSVVPINQRPVRMTFTLKKVDGRLGQLQWSLRLLLIAHIGLGLGGGDGITPVYIHQIIEV